MPRPTKPLPLSLMDRVTSLDITGETDLLLTSRLIAGTDFDNKTIWAKDWYNQIATAILAQVSGSSIASELTFKDGLAVEFFEDYADGPITVFNKGYGWSGNGVGTGCTIATKTGHGNTSPQQKRLLINSGQYGRKFAWGDSWSRIQLCILWRLNRASTFGPSAFYYGVCSGTTNMAGSATTDNFVGMRGPNNGATDATFTAGTRMNFFDINPSVRFASKVGASPTDRTSGSGSNGRHVSASEGFLSAFLIEIQRPTFATDGTSISYSFGRSMDDATQVEMSKAKSVLFDILLSDIGSTLSSGNSLARIICSGLAGVTVSYNFDQSGGKLDTFNLTWDQTFDAEIAAIGARKLW